MQLPTLFVLALVLAAERASSATWDEERLQWLVITKPGALQVPLNCTSEYIYPFTLLNDSSVIGALGSHIKRIWWLLPDGKQVNESYDDSNRYLVDRGVGLIVRQVGDSVHGLYHCAVEASTMINDTHFHPNRTTVYFYKRGLNLYGADVYGGNSWEKYKRNTLIGCLTSGSFLALVAGYALLSHFGVLAKCAGSANSVDILRGGGTEVGGIGEGAAPAETAEMTKTLALTPTEHSRASVRSRRAEPPAAETAA